MKVARHRGMKRAIVALARRLAVVMRVAFGLMAPSSAGLGKQQRHESTTHYEAAQSNANSPHPSSREGVRLDLLTARSPQRLFHLVFGSHDGRALVPIP
jgi:hypothetical protein